MLAPYASPATPVEQEQTNAPVEQAITADEIRSGCGRAEQIYHRRNNTIWRLRGLFQEINRLAAVIRTQAQTHERRDDWQQFLAMPDSFLQKFLAIALRGRPQIEAVSFQATDQDKKQSDLIEGFINLYKEDRNEAWKRKGESGTFAKAVLEAGFIDGHVYIYVYPEMGKAGLPFCAELWDATEVFPVWGSKGMVRCYRKTRMTLEMIRSTWPGVELDGDSFSERTVIFYYDQQVTAVCLEDGDFVQEPVRHLMGQCPVLHAFPRGRTLRRWQQGLQQQDIEEEQRGRSAMAAIESQLDTRRRLYEMWLARLQYESDPTMVTTVPAEMMDKDNPPRPVKRGDSARLLPSGSTAGPIDYKTPLSNIEAAIRQNDEDIFANLFRLDPMTDKQHPSGVEHVVSNEQAMTFFLPYMEELAGLEQWEYGLVLNCWRRFATLAPQLFPPLMVEHTTDDGEKSTSELRAEMVPADVRIRVSYRMHGLVEYLQIGSAVVGPKQAGIFSVDFILDDMLNVENPALIKRQILYDMAMGHPEVQKVMGLPLAIQAMRQLSTQAEMAGDRTMAMAWARAGMMIAMQLQMQQQQAMAPPGMMQPPGMAGQMGALQGGVGQPAPSGVNGGPLGASYATDAMQDPRIQAARQQMQPPPVGAYG
jgi:hypothetical protein